MKSEVYDIFISYRREGGADTAKHLRDVLTNKGYRVFFDTDSLRSGDFNQELLKVIEQCTDFIIILSANALDRCVNEGDWVRQELAFALKSNKNVIPIASKEFRFPETLPKEIDDVRWKNGITVNIEYFDAMMQKLVSFLYSKPKKKFPSRRRYPVVVACLLTLSFIIGIAVLMNSKLSNDQSSILKYEPDIDSHIIMKLSNANHQYEVGLENWRRLDYNRAERDILGAWNDISEEISQEEIDLAVVENSLGCLYLDMGRYDESYDYLNDAYVTFRNTYGDNSTEILAVLFSIAQYDYYSGDVDTALKTIQQIIDKIDMDNNAAIASPVLHFQAMIYDELGDYDAAIATYERVFQLYDDIIEDGKLTSEFANYISNPELSQSEKDEYVTALKWVVFTYNNLGEASIHAERYDDAQEILETGLEISLDNVYIGKKNLITSKLYMNLAKLYEEKGELKDAIDAIDLAMRIQLNLFDFEEVYPGLVEVYDIYGRLLNSAGKDDEAKTYYENALKLSIESFGKNHPTTAEAYNAIGVYHISVEDYSNAIKEIETAIEIRRDILGYENANTVEYLCNLAIAQNNNMQADVAADTISEAQRLVEKLGISGKLSEKVSEQCSIMR